MRPFKLSPAAALVAVTLLVLGLSGLALPAAAETVALVGATVHPMTGPAIADATVLIVGDTIEAVGTDVAVPDGARRIDVGGKHVYPGMIHPLTNLGLVEIGSVRGTVDLREVGDNNSDLRAEVAFNADSLRLPTATAGGVTHALIFQSGGLFSGTSAVMRLQGWNWQDMALQTNTGLHLWFPSTPEDEDDDESSAKADEAKEAMKALDESFARAAAYQKAKRAGTADLGVNPKLERLVQVLSGELRLIVHTRNRADIKAALDWLAENELTNAVLVVGYEARYVADKLAEAGFPVILNGVLALPRKSWEPYDAVYGAAAVLHEAGVRFCIGDGGGSFGSANARNLPFEAAMATAFGLDADVALRAITSETASILGIDDRVGSLEAGKEASLMVTDGNPLETLTNIESVWVAGRQVDPNQNHQYRLYQKYWNRPKPAD